MGDGNCHPVVLGIGNLLLRDEGFGIHLVRHLRTTGITPKAEIVDGGTGGIGLLDIVESATHLVVVDAVNGSGPPGTVYRMTGQEIPAIGEPALSQHQPGLAEVIALAGTRGKLPSEVVVIGVQPYSLDWGTELTPMVAEAVPQAAGLVAEQINNWLDRRKT